MAKLSEVYGRDDERTARQLYLVMALALLLAGSVVFAAGATRVVSVLLVAAGTPGTLAGRVAVVVGGLLPPALLSCALAALRTDRRAKFLAGAGAVLSAAGTAGIALTAGTGWRFGAAALTYVVGLLLTTWAVGRGVMGPRPADGRESISFAASTEPLAGNERRPAAADGGKTDDEISSPLDE